MVGMRWGVGLVLLLVVIPVPRITSAGSAPASLSCRSKGRNTVTLKGEIPGSELALDLQLTQVGKTITMTEDNGDSIDVTEAFSDRVFTLTVERKDGRNLQLRGLPRTMKVQRRRGIGGVHVDFDAMLVMAPKPGDAGGESAMIRNVRMTCTYELRI